MKAFWTTFLKGFAAVFPLLITLYLLFWLIGSLEALVGGIALIFLPNEFYVPGMGIVGSVFIIYAIGLYISRLGIPGRLADWAGRIMSRIPVVKTIYGSISNLTAFFSAAGGEREEARKVALVRLEDGTRLLGFVTGEMRDHLGDLPEDVVGGAGDGEADGGQGADKVLAVYLPMSYQVGGFTVYVPASRVTHLDMSFEDATQLVFTAGLGRREPRG